MGQSASSIAKIKNRFKEKDIEDSAAPHGQKTLYTSKSKRAPLEFALYIEPTATGTPQPKHREVIEKKGDSEKPYAFLCALMHWLINKGRLNKEDVVKVVATDNIKAERYIQMGFERVKSSRLA